MKKANYISLVEQTILFGTECFIKIHKEIENVRAKKKEVVNFVIFPTLVEILSINLLKMHQE